jgi:hypothetical protein
MRPTVQTREWIQTFTVEHLVKHPAEAGWSARTQGPPKEAVCMQVRHGDKRSEMA